MILLHTQSIICATVESQCLEYLECITLCKGRKIGGVSEKDMTWMLNHTQYDEREIRQLYLGKSLVHSFGNQNEKEIFIWECPRTTDAQRGNSLHCTAENSLPLPNF